jgi:hypothetical protein
MEFFISAYKCVVSSLVKTLFICKCIDNIDKTYMIVHRTKTTLLTGRAENRVQGTYVPQQIGNYI